jgi:hypothetical protein
LSHGIDPRSHHVCRLTAENENGSKRVRTDGARGCVEVLESGAVEVLVSDRDGADVGT